MKNQSCSKLPEMARKLDEHEYRVPEKNLLSKMKKSKLFEIA